MLLVFVQPAKESRLFPFAVLSRLLFIPLLMLCNVKGSRLPHIFRHDCAFVTIMALFSFSNGYLASLCMAYAPQWVFGRNAIETVGCIQLIKWFVDWISSPSLSVSLVSVSYCRVFWGSRCKFLFLSSGWWDIKTARRPARSWPSSSCWVWQWERRSPSCWERWCRRAGRVNRARRWEIKASRDPVLKRRMILSFSTCIRTFCKNIQRREDWLSLSPSEILWTGFLNLSWNIQETQKIFYRRASDFVFYIVVFNSAFNNKYFKRSFGFLF